MPKPNLKVAPPPPPRSPEREDLASAIKARRSAWENVKAAHEAVDHAKEMVTAAEARAASARAAIAEAKESRRAAIAAAAVRGERPSADTALCDARLEETSANDDAEDARVALPDLEAVAERHDGKLLAAARAVEQAVDRVMAASLVPSLLASARARQSKLVGELAMLRHLLARGIIADGEQQQGVLALLGEILPNRPAFEDASGRHWPSDPVPYAIQDARGGVPAWDAHVASLDAARKALLDDADAALPEAE